jgi:hypothetical protein
LSVGAVHASVTCRLPDVAVKSCGAVGTVSGYSYAPMSMSVPKRRGRLTMSVSPVKSVRGEPGRPRAAR